MLLLFAMACSKGDIGVSPAVVDWGEVDFHNAEPPDCDPDQGGCDPRTAAITNNGEGDVSLIADGFDSDHICVQGFASDSPIDLGSLGPGATYNLVLSVCAYGPGERDGTLTGDIVFELDGAKEDTAVVSWSFIPVRNIPVDDTAD